VVRLYFGYEFLEAGWHKFTDPRWMQSGEAILGYWQRAVAVPAPPARPLITFDWYRSFLQFIIDTNSAGWFTYVIVFGEIAVGLGLIVGEFVGVACKNAGYIGLDRFLLPILGTPWPQRKPTTVTAKGTARFGASALTGAACCARNCWWT